MTIIETILAALRVARHESAISKEEFEAAYAWVVQFAEFRRSRLSTTDEDHLKHLAWMLDWLEYGNFEIPL